jgi:hypothetical protein
MRLSGSLFSIVALSSIALAQSKRYPS